MIVRGVDDVPGLGLGFGAAPPPRGVFGGGTCPLLADPGDRARLVLAPAALSRRAEPVAPVRIARTIAMSIFIAFSCSCTAVAAEDFVRSCTKVIHWRRSGCVHRRSFSGSDLKR